MTAFGKNNPFYSTLMHVVELLVTFGVAVGIVKILGIDSETTTIVIGVVVNALAKFSRASDAIPVPDVVND